MAVNACFVGSFSDIDRLNKGKREEKSYAVAGGRAEQALAAIKTVKMLNGENY